MPIRTTLRYIAISAATVWFGMLTTGCGQRLEDSPAYRSACHGPPLRTAELLDQAMQDGYEINRQYNCVDKASFIAMAEQKAQWEAANTPEAIAKREAEFAAQRDRDRAQRARQAAIEASQPPEVLAPFVLRNVDVNTASEAEIADLPSVGPEVAAKIVDAREQRRFRDWPDLVNRVVGLSAAQPAVYASICGLNVDGKSLEGAPADATMAATIYREHQRRASK